MVDSNSPSDPRPGAGFHIVPLNWLLLAVFAGLFGFWLSGDGAGVVEERAVRPLFEEFDGDAAQSIVLERADRAAVDTGGIERTTLTLQPAATAGAQGIWTIHELFDAAAFRDRVERLLSRIGSMTTLDLVSADAERHAEYGLAEDRALRIRVSTGQAMGDSPMVDLLLAPAPDRGAWVRKFGENEVWRIARFNPPSPAPAAWFDDASLMPLGERAIRFIRASGAALTGDVSILFVPGAERFVDEAGVGWEAPRVLDLQSRLRTLFPVNVTGSKAVGESLNSTGAGDSAEPAWLRLEISALLGGKSFHLEFAEPTEGSTECAAVRVEGTTRVTVASSTVRKIMTSLNDLLAAQK